MRKHIAALIASALVLSVTDGMIAQHSHHEHQTQQEQEKMQKYTCPMHHEVITDHPGNCPKCGMKLVLIKKGEHRMSNAERSTSKVGTIDPNRPRHEHDHPPPVTAATHGTAGEHENMHPPSHGGHARPQ